MTSGVAGLPESLAAEVGVRLSTSLMEVVDDGSGVVVTASSPDGERSERFDGAVIATTAPPASKLSGVVVVVKSPVRAAPVPPSLS